MESEPTAPSSAPSAAKMLLGKLDKVGRDFRNLFLDSETADVLVVCGTETLVAHRAVLLARSRRGFFGPRHSKRWRKRSTNGVTIDVLELNELDPSIVTKVLEYVYAGMVAVEPDQLLPVAIAADYLQVDGLSNHCAEKLVGTATLENAFENLDVLTGSSASLKPAVDHYVNFIGENAGDLLDCEDILMLREPAMAVLLQSNCISCPEEEVFESFLKWGLHNNEIQTLDPTEWPADKVQKLREFLAETAKHIRLDLIKPKYLVDVVEPTGLFTHERLLSCYRQRSLELAQQVGELATPSGKFWHTSVFADKMTFEAELRDFDPAQYKPKDFAESPRVRLADTPFTVNVKFYPKGLDENDPDPSAGLYLKVMPATMARVPPEWHIFVKYRLILNDGSLGRVTAEENGSSAAKAVGHTFSRTSLDWGYKKFTKLTRIQDMMQSNGSSVLSFRVVVTELVNKPTLEQEVAEAATIKE